MKIYLVVLQTQDLYEIDKAFISKKSAEVHCNNINSSIESTWWQYSIDELEVEE
jgi:hypothetical protein